MTPGFDPTQVDWNNPGVEYLMKNFERIMADHRDEIMLYRERKVREQNTKFFTNMIMPMAKNQLKWNFEPHPTLGCMN